MFAGSLFVSWLSKLILLIRRISAESVVCRLCRRFAAFISRLFSGSSIIGLFRRDGYLVRIWEHSGVLKLTDWLLNAIPCLLNRLYTRFEAAFEKSLIFRAIRFLSRHTATITALFIAVALVVPHSRWNNMYTTIAALGLLLLFLVKAMTDGETRLAVKVLDVFLFIFILMTVLAQVFSVFPGLSLRFLVFILTDLAIMLVLVSSIKTKEQFSTVLEIILAGAALSGLYGVYQSIRGVPVVVSQIDTTLNEGMPGRVFSAFDNANNFAQIIVMLIPLFAAIILNAKGWQKRFVFFMAALPLFISLLTTLSRSGWIGFAVSTVVFIFLVKPGFVLLLALIGAASYPFLPATIIRRISTITNLQDATIQYRFDIWKTMWPMLKDFWLTGIGLGSDAVKQVNNNYEILTKTIPPHSHNIYYQIWLETGIVGLVAFLGSMLRTVKRSLKTIYGKDADPWLKNVLIAGISGLCGVLVIAAAEYIWYYPRVMLVFWVLMGIILTALRLAAPQKAEND